MIPRTHAIVSFLTLAAGYAAEAQIQFVDQTTTRFPVQAEYTNQIGVADIDADGDLDMCFANGRGYSSLGALLKPRIYINNGAGVFSDQTDTRVAGITGCFRSAEFADVDGDGDADLLLGQDYSRQMLLLINNGAGVFANETTTRIPTLNTSTARATFGDVDGDGDFDIALCNSGTSRFGTTGQPRLYLNDGGGRFTDATTGRIPTGNIAQQMDILFLDADGDFDLDLFVGTRATTPNQSRLWLNNGAGVFTAGGNFPNDATCYAYDAGDIDSDGDLDLIGTNAGTSNTELIAKNLNGLGTSWINVSASISPNPMVDDNDSKFFDIDNDGDLDLVIAVLGGTKRIYRNSGTGAFTQVTNIITAASDSSLDVKVADFDGDGRYDIVTGQGESGAFQNRIYMNNGPIDTLPPINVRTEQVIAGTVVGAAHPVRVELRDAYTSHMGFHARSVTLRYGTGAVLSQTVPMKLTGNCLWRGVMPAQSPGSVVSYSVRSVDAFGNTGDGPILTFTEFGTHPNPADRNGDGFVDGLDLAIILAAWGTTEVAGDANGDGFVDGVDLAIVLSAFGL
ncbi:MAG: FG-GAP-like repeat-containing protein [Planctomycetota bacterium]|nr:FG-GAP-like repeat-containing protein [Planctomycetota bacterium]